VLAADFVVDSRGDLGISLGKRTAHTVRHVAILDYLPGGFGWQQVRVLSYTVFPNKRARKAI
jgi:hypothetical protein